MKAMGFRWDEERRTWTRRPPDVKKPPKPLRSGMRLLKLNGASPDERAAAEVFMERLRTARKASFRDTDTSTKLSKFLKYCLSQPATLPVFAVACVGLGVAAAANGGADVGSLDATTLTCGLAAGVPVAAARVAAHKASAGSEPPDGRALERSIVDIQEANKVKFDAKSEYDKSGGKPAPAGYRAPVDKHWLIDLVDVISMCGGQCIASLCAGLKSSEDDFDVSLFVNDAAACDTDAAASILTHLDITAVRQRWQGFPSAVLSQVEDLVIKAMVAHCGLLQQDLQPVHSISCTVYSM